MSLRSHFLRPQTSLTAQPSDSTGRRTFLKRSGLAASSLALLGNFPLGWLPKASAGNPPPERTADAGSAGAGPRPDSATTALRGVTPGVNPELRAHGAIFERKIHKIGDNVYSAVGWSGCNTIMVVGNDGVIIVDTGDGVQWAREVAAEFRAITDKPVRAVIYTCFHIDHMFGVKAFATADDVQAGRVEIIAHESLLAQCVAIG
jgi:Metallo-beta-lactamase superfamily